MEISRDVTLSNCRPDLSVSKPPSSPLWGAPLSQQCPGQDFPWVGDGNPGPGITPKPLSQTLQPQRGWQTFHFIALAGECGSAGESLVCIRLQSQIVAPRGNTLLSRSQERAKTFSWMTPLQAAGINCLATFGVGLLAFVLFVIGSHCSPG